MLLNLVATVVAGTGLYTTLIAVVAHNPGDGLQGVGTLTLAFVLVRLSSMEKRMIALESAVLNSKSKGQSA